MVPGRWIPLILEWEPLGTLGGWGRLGSWDPPSPRARILSKLLKNNCQIYRDNRSTLGGVSLFRVLLFFVVGSFVGRSLCGTPRCQCSRGTGRGLCSLTCEFIFALSLGVTRPSTCSDSCWGVTKFPLGRGWVAPPSSQGAGPGLVGSVRVGGNRRGGREKGRVLTYLGRDHSAPHPVLTLQLDSLVVAEGVQDLLCAA